MVMRTYLDDEKRMRRNSYNTREDERNSSSSEKNGSSSENLVDE
jgi:hypothetical protein